MFEDNPVDIGFARAVCLKIALIKEFMNLILETELPNLFYRGKVRDLYALGNELLVVATDRISAFDSVLPSGVPYKGLVLNMLSAFWFQKTAHIMPNHFIQVVDDVDWLNVRYGVNLPPYIAHRSMLVKKAERISIECVVRGYLSGSAWAEYSQSGTIQGISPRKGLRESEWLPQPLFTPTTKETSGHDRPISLEEMASLVSRTLTEKLVEKSLAIYKFAEEYARSRGIVIADTKFEFGLIEGKLHLIDELLTPDSSRFWDAKAYAPGGPQPSFDKQPVRDWLIRSGWNKEPPAPPLSEEVITETSQRYREAYHRLTGKWL
jgi:phosphoribosylaminoimidazole-succinocarboxamide synthase